jgi:hypothetical protein
MPVMRLLVPFGQGALTHGRGRRVGGQGLAGPNAPLGEQPSKELLENALPNTRDDVVVVHRIRIVFPGHHGEP